jgi:hypothetical protein
MDPAPTTTEDRPAPGAGTGVPGRREALVGALAVAWLPWAVGLLLTLGALGLAKYVVRHLHVTGAKAVLEAHAGLLGSDAGWYQTIAAHGYAAAGRQGLRFFPLLPLLARGLHLVGLPYSAGLLLLANGAALAATMALVLLARAEGLGPGTGRRAAWLLNLAPPAFVLVMGYADALLLAFSVAAFFALRRRWWLLAGALGLLAGLTRPVGLLLVVPAAVEAARGLGDTGWAERGRRLLAVAGPVAGTVAYLAWVAATWGGFLTPLRVQVEAGHHGAFSDPAVTVWRAAGRAVHHHDVGTGLHLPWIALAVVLVVVALRRLPLSYGLFALAVLVVAVSGTNLDSFERYALTAFPLVLSAATCFRRPATEAAVYALSAGALVGYAVLAFLGAYVP